MATVVGTAKVEQKNIIDQAIGECEQEIRRHREMASKTILNFTIAIIFLSIFLLALNLVGLPFGMLSSLSNAPLMQYSILLPAVVIFAFVFAVTLSLYRFHLNKVAKAEQSKIGLLRVRLQQIIMRRTMQPRLVRH